MPTFAEIESIKAKKICNACVGEPYLSAEIRETGSRSVCSFCGHRRRTIRLDILAARIDSAFERHYVLTSDQPDALQYMMLSDRESDYDWDRDGEPVVQAIANAADIPEEAAEDIQALLDDEYGSRYADEVGEETPYSGNTYYEERAATDERWQEEWREFERSLKTEARFFNETGKSHLDSLFRGVEGLRTMSGRPVLVQAGPGTAFTGFFRARAFQSESNLLAAMCRPDTDMGPPPAAVADAGRMNARGVSVLYAATEPSAAIAEVRPPVGSRVGVVRFDIIRPLTLVDLTAMADIAEGGSIFDTGLADRLEKAAFLRTLTAKIARPVMPDDQASDYLPTQAIADYLATRASPTIDGILFPSVQVAGNVLNVVLFHKSSRVELLPLPEDSKLEATTGHNYSEEWETEYTVTETVPTPEPIAEEPVRSDTGWPFFPGAAAWEAPDPDPREAALRVDPASMVVHEIRMVEFSTREHRVTRHRHERAGRGDLPAP